MFIVPPRIEVKHSSQKYIKAQKRECPKILSTAGVLSQVYLSAVNQAVSAAAASE